MLSKLDERIVKSKIISYLHKAFPTSGVVDLQLSVDEIDGNDVTVSLVYPNVELHTDTVFPVSDEVWDWYFKRDSYNLELWKRRMFLNSGALHPITWWNCKCTSTITFEENGENYVSVSNTPFVVSELLNLEKYMWLLTWDKMQVNMYEKAHDGKAIPAELVDYNPILLKSEYATNRGNTRLPIYMDCRNKITILGESLNRQLAKEERLVQRIDMERDELEDLMLSLDDSGHQVVFSMPDLDLYAMRNTVGFLDDLKVAVEQGVKRYVKPIEYTPELVDNAQLVRNACDSVLNGIPIYLQALNTLHEKHTKPRMLFFKGASQEDIDEFEGHVKDFTNKMKQLLASVDKLIGRS